MRVLITNRILSHRTGTELYVRDLALGLLARGHAPIVYSPQLGALAAEVRAATVPVVDDITRIGAAPDIIHGHHALETLTALLACPGVPAIQVCHSWVGWADAPVRFPRIRRYVAVDDTCRDRLVFEHGIPEARVPVALNFVDLARFAQRPPLPPRPMRALVFSNSAASSGSHLDAVRQACERAGIALDVAGHGTGNLLTRPEDVLGRYDLVFAKARAALEAMAVGAAVILCDVAGAGPLVTTGNVDRLRRLNFGMRALRERPSAEALAREIALYDAADAAAVSARIRASVSRDVVIDDLVALYEDVIAEHAAGETGVVEDEGRAAAAFLESLARPMYQRDILRAVFTKLLRVPVLGTLIRARARRGSRSHWLAQLLRSIEDEQERVHPQ